MKIDLKNFYKDLAIVLLNILILFLVLNIFCWIVISFHNAPEVNKKAGPLAIYPAEVMQKAYENMSVKEVEDLLTECWAPQSGFWQYEPFIEWQEPERHGKYLNVSPVGYRYTVDQGEWPPSNNNYNIFVFGGSTSFGYGAGDNETYSSYLQLLGEKATSTKPIKVYNFGMNNYSSTNERALFESLLVRGYVPNAVVFFDGLNDFFPGADPNAISTETKIIRKAVNLTIKDNLETIADSLPIVDFSQKLAKKIQVKTAPKISETASSTDKHVGQAVERYLSNKKMIEGAAEKFGIKAVFVMQPVPYYDFDNAKDDLFYPFRAPAPWVAEAYAAVKEKSKDFNNFLWLADIQNKYTAQLYVDTVHYTPRFNKIIAQNIFDYMIAHNFLETRKELKKK